MRKWIVFLAVVIVLLSSGCFDKGGYPENRTMPTFSTIQGIILPTGSTVDNQTTYVDCKENGTTCEFP